MFYDYKSEELTQECNFSDIGDLSGEIFCEWNRLHRYELLSVYATTAVVRDILIELGYHEDFILDEELIDWDLLLYTDNEEVCLTIGYDGMVSVDGHSCTNDETSITFYYDRLSQKTLDKLEQNATSVLVFSLADDEDEEESPIVNSLSINLHFYTF